MLRSEIKETDKWDLTPYFKNKVEYDKYYDETLKLIDKVVSYKGKIMKDSDANTDMVISELIEEFGYNETNQEV